MPYKIYPLKNGECMIAGNHAFYKGNRDERDPFVLWMWLIKGGETPMLVDAGLRDVDEMNRGAAHVLAKPITQAADETSEAQLEKHGLTPDDIGYVFITHLHFDHVDNLDLYKNAKIVVSKRGLDAATANPGWVGSWAPGKTLMGLTDTWKDRVIAVDDTEVLPGINVFWVGGHTPCSQMIKVETAEKSAILTGDTVFLQKNLERNIPIGVYDNIEECRAAMKSLANLDAIILPGHDANVFERFPEGVIG